jgi:hypothetical protein
VISVIINGYHFTSGSVVNFFISTATGPVNVGPLRPSSFTSSSSARTASVTGAFTQLTVPLPAGIRVGEGFADVEVINTDQGYAQSNPMPASEGGAHPDRITN